MAPLFVRCEDISVICCLLRRVPYFPIVDYHQFVHVDVDLVFFSSSFYLFARFPASDHRRSSSIFRRLNRGHSFHERFLRIRLDTATWRLFAVQRRKSSFMLEVKREKKKTTTTTTTATKWHCYKTKSTNVSLPSTHSLTLSATAAKSGTSQTRMGITWRWRQQFNYRSSRWSVDAESCRRSKAIQLHYILLTR